MASKDPTPQFTEADGRQLAVDLLRELDEWHRQVNERECAKIQDDQEEPDMTSVLLNEEPVILRRYLETVRSTCSPQLERGFLCVLSDFMAGNVDGGHPERFEEYLEPRHG